MASPRLRDEANEALSKGRFARAAGLFEEYCELEPKDYQARVRLGDAWVKVGDISRAISAYQSAAEGFAREGLLPRAIAASKLILELDASHQGVQQMLASLYARRGGAARALTPWPLEAPAVAKQAALSLELPPDIGEAPGPEAPSPLPGLEIELDLSEAENPPTALQSAPPPRTSRCRRFRSSPTCRATPSSRCSSTARCAASPRAGASSSRGPGAMPSTSSARAACASCARPAPCSASWPCWARGPSSARWRCCRAPHARPRW